MQTQTIQSADGILERDIPAGILSIVKSTAPTNGQSGYSIGCLWRNRAGTAGAILYLNQGTSTSSTWLAIA